MIAKTLCSPTLLLTAGLTEGLSSPGAAGSGLALFLLGLITGVGAAVAAFFAYLHIIRTRELSRGMETFAEGEEILPDSYEEPSSTSADAPSARPPQRMPWERPEDWWRHHDEEDC